MKSTRILSLLDGPAPRSGSSGVSSMAGRRHFCTFKHLLGYCNRTTALTLALALASAGAARANTFTVNTPAPGGPGSLLEAINQANLNPGPDVIQFDFPSYPQIIKPLGALPDIVDSVVIDATIPPNCVPAYKPLVAIDGSLAGLNVNGLRALGTVSGPIAVTIKGLAIYSFSQAGIVLANNTNSVIQGNYLGTDPNGLVPFPNGNRGLVLDSCTNVVVGGAQPCERNVISGNKGPGIDMLAGAANRVVGNLVGLTANGLWPMPNGVGLSLTACSQCQIGSLTPGEGNVISRNVQAGIQINGGLFVPLNNFIEGNFIGTLPDGTSAAGNGGEGIFFYGGPTKNTVRGNTIAWNVVSGVSVLEGIDNTIVENSIFNNGGLGIDITPTGVPNINDPCDVDAGPNRQQNYPILSGAFNISGALQIDGSLDSEPGLSFRLDFYWSPVCDPSGFGEGRHYIGHTTLDASASGCVTPFSVPFPVGVPPGTLITATATHPQGSTSEFSPCTPVVTTGKGMVTHAGLPHSPLNGAVITETNDWLVVSGLDSGGSNGVRLVAGRAQGWMGALDSLQLLPGESLLSKVFRDDASNSALLANAKLAVDPKGLTIGGQFNIDTPILSPMLRLELRDDLDQLIAAVRFPNGGQYHLPACTNGQDYIVCSNAYVSLNTGEPAFCWKFCRVVCLPPGMFEPPYLPPVRTACLVWELPNQVVHCLTCVDVGTNQFSELHLVPQLGAANPGGGLMRVGKEWLQQFGQFHEAISNVTLTGWAQHGGAGTQESLFALVPSIVGVGPGGGCLNLLLDRARHIGLGWDPVATGQGVMPYRLNLIIGTNHISDSTVIQSGPNGANISFDFTASGTITGRLDFFFRGQPSGSMSVLTGTALVASSAPLRASAATSPYTPTGTRGFAFYWPDPVSMFIPGTPLQAQADEVRIVPIDPATPLRWLTHLELESDQLAGFEVTSEATRPAVPGPLGIELLPQRIRLSYPTEVGRPYLLQSISTLPPNTWTLLENFMGDGSVRTFEQALQVGPSRFYRLEGL